MYDLVAHHYIDVLFCMCSVYLITNPKLRAEHMNRVEVLDRVGGLLLLPNTELATTKQVAEFYGVDVEAIKWHIKTNREELESNGVKLMPYREVKELVNGEFNPLYKISKRGATIFNKRAILLVGFMLRDSSVAQEVRNQALNIIESASTEQKTMEITKEKELLMAIMFAENEVERATAINTVKRFELTNHVQGQFSNRLTEPSGADNKNTMRMYLTDNQWKTFRKHFKASRDDIEQAYFEASHYIYDFLLPMERIESQSIELEAI